MESIKDTWRTLRSMNIRQLASQGVNLGLIISSALIIWKSMMLITGSDSPVVVVLTGSMEPGFRRGDILFLNLGTAPVRTGEIVVFKLEGKSIPIVHRAVTVHQKEETSDYDVLTKGDNNYADDRWGGIYPPGLQWLHKEHVIGRVVGYLPHVGYVTIVMNDYPWLKYALIGSLAMLVLVSKE